MGEDWPYKRLTLCSESTSNEERSMLCEEWAIFAPPPENEKNEAADRQWIDIV